MRHTSPFLLSVRTTKDTSHDTCSSLEHTDYNSYVVLTSKSVSGRHSYSFHATRIQNPLAADLGFPSHRSCQHSNLHSNNLPSCMSAWRCMTLRHHPIDSIQAMHTYKIMYHVKYSCSVSSGWSTVGFLDRSKRPRTRGKSFQELTDASSESGQ